MKIPEKNTNKMNTNIALDMESFKYNTLELSTAYNEKTQEIPKNALESQKRNYCECCNYSTNNKKDFNKHLFTKKHINMTEIFEKNPEYLSNPKYYCESCNYISQNKTDYIRHMNTKKHFKTLENLNAENEVEEDLDEKMEPKDANNLISTNMLVDILKQNKELQQALIEQTQELQNSLIEQNQEIQNSLFQQNKDIQNTLAEISKQAVIINNQNNTMHNQFNLNLFLNEDCKNALNIAEFVASLKLTVQDIEETGRLGFIEGITRIFVHALRALDVNMRPLHCTDIKRETIYIKDQDTWEKEDAEKTKLRHVLKQIARKNLRMLPAWQEQNPNYVEIDTPENDQFIQISLSALGAESGDEEVKHEDKIIRNVIKEVGIDKARLK